MTGDYLKTSRHNKNRPDVYLKTLRNDKNRITCRKFSVKLFTHSFEGLVVGATDVRREVPLGLRRAPRDPPPSNL